MLIALKLHRWGTEAAAALKTKIKGLLRVLRLALNVELTGSIFLHFVQ